MDNKGSITASDLLKKHKVEFEEHTQPLDLTTVKRYLAAVPEWQLERPQRISRGLQFEDFAGSVRFFDDLAQLTFEVKHHPDVCISERYVNISLFTHKIGGLSENDFMMAAKIDQLINTYEGQQGRTHITAASIPMTATITIQK
ncbi:MAG: 4a-hydroxytetrahydrobiopterin dehydratase [Halobacteriota archaeon]